MKADPTEGDWCQLILNDFKESNTQINKDQERQIDQTQYKSLI